MGDEMMSDKRKAPWHVTILTIIVWGTLWGMFEATIGYLLHRVSFGYSWVIWYPVACYFMSNVYRKTGRVSSIAYTGLLCAAMKLLNLFLPGRIDRVVNPALSIVFESVALAGMVLVVKGLRKEKQNSPSIKALAALMMNTGWRALFAFYLLFLVPDWIRDISVISSVEKFTPFFITQNLITSALIFMGYQWKQAVIKPVIIVENHLSNRFRAIPKRAVPMLQASLATLMLCANVALQLLLQ